MDAAAGGARAEEEADDPESPARRSHGAAVVASGRGADGIDGIDGVDGVDGIDGDAIFNRGIGTAPGAPRAVSGSINPLCPYNDHALREAGGVHANGLFDGPSEDADLGGLEAFSAASKFTDLSPRQHWMRKFVDSMAFQSVLVCLILLDVALLIADAVAEDVAMVSAYSIALVSVLALELAMRAYAYGKYFRSDPLNFIDSAVVLVSVLVLALFDSKAASIVNLGRIARVVRTVWNSGLILAKGFSTKEHAARAARLKVPPASTPRARAPRRRRR